MKRSLSIILILISAFAFTSRAQNVAVGLHSGFSSYINNTSIGIPVGLNAEWAYDAKHSFVGRAQYNIGLRSKDADFFYIAPEYKYHVVGEALDGFYIGAYMGFGGGGGTGYISLGAVTGYSFFVGEKFNLEANLEIGYGNFTNLEVHALHLVPTIGFRYGF